MFGYVEWSGERRNRRGVDSGERRVAGLSFFVLRLYREERLRPLALRRRCQAGAKLLRRSGVTRAVFPRDFPYGELFAAQGVEPVSELALRRELGAEFALRAMNQRGISSTGATVAVAAERLSPEVQRTVTALCRRSRYVLLSAPYGCGEFCRELRRSCGVSILQDPTTEQLEQADALLLYTPKPELEGGKGICLPLYEGGMLAWEGDLPGKELPEDCDRGQLLAALWQAGAIRAEAVEVKSLGLYA